MGSLIGECVNSLRFECTGRWPVHFFQKSLGVAAAVMLAVVPITAANAQATTRAQPVLVSQTAADFYKGRNGYPLWLSANAGDAAQQLLTLLSSSNIDGIDPSHYDIPALQLNLERARVLPAGKQRYVIVNAAQQRLYMYENGKPVDSMVVVVGKPKWATPMMTAYIRYAALNPYWYVPPDLAGEDVGQFVVKQGLGYLDKMG